MEYGKSQTQRERRKGRWHDSWNSSGLCKALYLVPNNGSKWGFSFQIQSILKEVKILLKQGILIVAQWAQLEAGTLDQLLGEWKSYMYVVGNRGYTWLGREALEFSQNLHWGLRELSMKRCATSPIPSNSSQFPSTALSWSWRCGWTQFKYLGTSSARLWFPLLFTPTGLLVPAPSQSLWLVRRQ